MQGLVLQKIILIPGQVSFDKAVIDFDLGDLWGGKVEALEVFGLELDTLGLRELQEKVGKSEESVAGEKVISPLLMLQRGVVHVKSFKHEQPGLTIGGKNIVISFDGKDISMKGKIDVGVNRDGVKVLANVDLEATTNISNLKKYKFEKLVLAVSAGEFQEKLSFKKLSANVKGEIDFNSLDAINGSVEGGGTLSGVVHNGKKMGQVRIDEFVASFDKEEVNIHIKKGDITSGKYLLSSIEFEGKKKGTAVEFELKKGAFSQKGGDYFLPFHFLINGTGTKKEIKAKGTLKGVKSWGHLLKFQGPINLSEKAGKIDFLVDSLNNANFFDQFPIVKNYLKSATGKVELSSQVKFKQDVLYSQVRTRLRSWDFEHKSGAVVKGMSVDIAIENLTKTLGVQKIFFDEINLGEKLQNGEILFEYESPKLMVRKTKFSWNRAIIEAGLFTVDMKNNQVEDLNFSVKNLSFQKMLKLVLQEKIQANGVLAGSIPVIFDGKRVSIKNGLLKSSGKGHLSYLVEKGMGLSAVNHPSVNLLLEYLKDFYYDEVALKFNSDRDYNLSVNLSLLGRNPQVYDGRPLKLNVNLNFNLWDIFVYALRYINIPKTLERAILQKVQK